MNNFQKLISRCGVIAVAVTVPTFMEVLDTSIANVALPYMAGNLGASNDQSTWVLTSYLVSNAIVLPISGWLAGAFGRKRFFSVCLFVFTASSLLCGIAPSLGLLLVFRVLQGAGGGGLQPMRLPRPRLVQLWAGGSRLIIRGDGFFSLIYRLAC